MTQQSRFDVAARLDRVGRALMAGGGCLTLIVFPLVLMGLVAFGAMLAIGFAEDTARVAAEAEGVMTLALVVLGAISLVLLGLWILALRGRRWAQVLTFAIGAILAFLAFPFPERLGPDYQRPEDIQFTAAQLLVSMVPACLAVGSLLRLVARREARTRG